MKYLFIGGAPRSGTSALTELLSTHERVAIGMERFKFCYSKKSVTKEMFTKDNFFRFDSTQTNIDDKNGKYVDFYQKLSNKFDGSSIVGDKYPQLYKFWPSLFENFGEDGRFLFIMRDIEDVASSFNVRASNPKDKWPEENNYKKAVEIWNQSLLIAAKAKSENKNICIVSYSKLFDSESYACDEEMLKIIRYLDLSDNEELILEHKKLQEKYVSHIKNKSKLIFEGQKQYIKEKANKSLYFELFGL